MIRCGEGHLYDPARHSGCPWCARSPDVASADAMGGRTMPLRQAMPEPIPPTVPHRSAEPAAPATLPVAAPSPQIARTQRIIRAQQDIDPVVGWLVSVEGPERGKDYRLRAEKNFIGRDASMNVCIASDPSVSREKHAAVAFDPAGLEFWLLPGDASGLVYLNGKLVHSPIALAPRDIVQVGKTKLMLVPFVDAAFRWPEEMQAF